MALNTAALRLTCAGFDIFHRESTAHKKATAALKKHFRAAVAFYLL